MTSKRRPPNVRRIEKRIIALDNALAAGEAPAGPDDAGIDDELRERLSGTHDLLARLNSLRRHHQPTLGPPGEPTAESGPPRRLGRFELLRELGRGGQGVVFLARDSDLRRELALKVPRPELVFDDDLRTRFRQEAQAAAALDHPNIVAIHEIGEVDAVCFIAAAYVAGPTLAQWLREHRVDATDRQIAQLVEALSEAVAHAHARNVLHRDLKPANVLLEPLDAANSSMTIARPLDRFVPKLTDFGLARVESPGRGQTHTGSLVGTPAYMAPEQACGRVREIGPATDVYALGAILYELLTGRPPFLGENDADTLRLVAADHDVVAPSRLRPGLPSDLEAICLKCLERQPAARYVSAAELAADLRRYLSSQPTVARPIGVAARAWKWSRRKPAVAALLLVSVVGVLSLLGVSLLYTATLTATLADLQRSEAARRESLYAADIQLAARAVDEGNPTQARRLLTHCLPGPGEADVRGFEWYLLDRTISAGAVELEQSGVAYGVKYSPDGRWIAGGHKDGILRLWDATTGKLQQSWDTRHGETNGLAFSPDGTLLATAGDDGAIRVWNRATGALLGEILQAHPSQCWNVQFTPDGKSLASCGNEPFVRVWDVATRSAQQTFDAGSRYVHAIDLSPDGTLLAAACDDGRARVWDLASGEQRHDWRVSDVRVNDVAFQHDGRLLGTASADGRVAHWSLSSEELLWSSEAHADDVQTIALEAGVSVSGDRSGRISVRSAHQTELPSMLNAWQTKLLPPLRSRRVQAGDRFGQSMALDGDLLVIGSPDSHGDEIARQGAVSVNQHDGQRWRGRHFLMPDNPRSDMHFGTAVALAGNRIAVTALAGQNRQGESVSNQIFLYRTGPQEAEQLSPYAILTPPEPAERADSHFGQALAWQGESLATADPVAHDREGRVYLYDTSDHSTTELPAPTILPPPATHQGAEFGRTIALSGERLVVGCGTADGTTDAAKVWLFERHPEHGWQLAAELQPDEAAPTDRFGAALAIEGDTVLVAAPDQPQSEGRRGAVYVFHRTTSGEWEQIAKLTNEHRWADLGFGDSVALEDGVIVVGALARAEVSHGGSLHIFQPSTPGGTDWRETNALVTERAADAFGHASHIYHGTVLSAMPRQAGSPFSGAVLALPLGRPTPAAAKVVGSEEGVSNWSAHEGAIWSVALSPDGSHLVSAGNDGAIRQWPVARAANPRTIATQEIASNILDFLSESQVVTAPGGYSNVNKSYFTIWKLDPAGDESCTSWPDLMNGALALSPDGNSMVIAHFGMQRISQHDGRLLQALDFPGDWYDVKFTPDGREVAAAEHAADYVAFINLASATQRCRTPLPDPRCLEFLDDERLAVASQQEVVILSRRDGAIVGRWMGHQAGVRALSAAPDGSWLASSGEDRTVRLWDTKTGQERFVMSGHREPVRSLDASPDGRTLASGSADGTLRLWHAPTGQPLAVFPCSAPVQQVRFSPSGKRLIVLTTDGQLTFFDASPPAIPNGRLSADAERAAR